MWFMGEVETASSERRHVRSLVIYSHVRGPLVVHVQPASPINTDYKSMLLLCSTSNPVTLFNGMNMIAPPRTQRTAQPLIS